MLFILILSQSLWAQNYSWVELRETEIFHRCYIRMVRTPVPSNDPLLKKVKDGDLTAEAACMKIFDKAKLAADGAAMRIADVGDLTSRAVLKTFNQLHMGWFQNPVTGETNLRNSNAMIHDVEEPALYFTRALFGPDIRYDSVVKANGGLRGVRVRDRAPTSTRYSSQNFFHYKSWILDTSEYRISYSMGDYGNGPVGGLSVPDHKLTASGQLVGIESTLPLILPQYYPLGRAGNVFLGTKPSNRKAIHLSTCIDNSITPPSTVPDPDCVVFRDALLLTGQNMNLNQHHGGGVLGSFTFITNNTNLSRGFIPFHEDLVHRRIGARVIEDLMCLQLPALKPEDVQDQVQASSDYPFRQSSSCMSCHSSMDNIGSVYRNLFFNWSSRSGSDQTVGQSQQVLYRLPASSNNVYALQAPTGILKFRHPLAPDSASIVAEPVDGIEELGVAIAQQPEFYRCAAKRYYKFFTGVDVSLTAREKEPLKKLHQDFVVSLGDQLRTDQSLRHLVHEIFKSAAFKTRNYKAEAKK